jgi:hypothetical protein
VQSFESWRQRVREDKVHRRKALKIVTRLMQRAVVEAYETWREHAREEREHTRKALKIVQRVVNRVLVVAYEAWKEHAGDERERNGKTRKIVKRMLNRALMEGLSAWRAYMQEDLRLRRSALRIVKRMRNRMVLRGVAVWRQRCVEKKKLKRRLMMFMQRVVARYLAHGFVLWREQVRELRQHRLKAIRVVTQIIYRVLLDGFVAWREIVRQERGHKRKALKVVQRMLNRALVEGFVTWRAHVIREKEGERVQKQRTARALKVVTRMLKRVLVEAYQCWRAHAWEERRLRVKGAQVIHRKIKMVLKHAFGLLMAYCARRSWMLEVGSRLMLGWMDCQIRSLVSEWYSYAADSRRKREARNDTQRLTRILEMTSQRALVAWCWQWWSTVWSWRKRHRARSRGCLQMLALVRHSALVRCTWDAWLFFHAVIRLLNNPSHGVNKILRIRNPPSSTPTAPPPMNRASPVRGRPREGGEVSGGGGSVWGSGSGPLNQLSPLRSPPRDASPAKSPRSPGPPTGRGGGGGGRATPRGGRLAFAKGPVMERVVRYSYSKALDQWLTSELQVVRDSCSDGKESYRRLSCFAKMRTHKLYICTVLVLTCGVVSQVYYLLELNMLCDCRCSSAAGPLRGAATANAIWSGKSTATEASGIMC